ncbi:MAG TPA: aminodeoxychorismate lyase [Gammaproteobacteria bacterium]|nr:aminodeoxychorismate lyase [Gammaproteobacteria bacterium]
MNGKPSTCLPVSDRGLHYGDGVFETIRIPNKNLPLEVHPLWKLHIRRLKKGCERLDLCFPGEELLAQEVEQIRLPNICCVIKIILTRAGNQFGYSPNTNATNRIVMITHRGSMHTPSEFHIARSKINLAKQPFLAGIKHLNRLENVLAAKEINASFQEVILCNEQDEAIEGSRTNIFALNEENVWLTPALENGGVEGVLRTWILQHAAMLNISCEIASIPYAKLCQARAIFLTNSVIGIVPVARIQDMAKSCHPVKPIQRLWSSAWQ